MNYVSISFVCTKLFHHTTQSTDHNSQGTLVVDWRHDQFRGCRNILLARVGNVSIGMTAVLKQFLLTFCSFHKPGMNLFNDYYRTSIDIPFMSKWIMFSIPDSKIHGPTWGPHGAARAQVGPMSATWTLLSGIPLYILCTLIDDHGEYDINFDQNCFIVSQT